MLPRRVPPRSARPRIPLPALLLVLAATLMASPAAAQAVRALVVDAATGAPVAEALVRVESADGSLAGATFTGEEGVATVRLRQGGTYRLVAERGGYEPLAETLAVGPGGTVDVRLRMAQRPFSIDTVEVIARGRNERGREGFARRRRMHEGVFLDSAYLAQQRAVLPSDLLIGVPGIRMWAGREGRRPVSTRGWGCMVTLLDGVPVPTGPDRRLERMIRTRDVVGMEVYREYREVPPEYRIYARQRGMPCGVYLYWTRVRW